MNIKNVFFFQENVLKDDEEIVELLEAGSIIYICGDLNKIRQEIINTLIVCFQKVKRVSEEDAKIMFEKLQKNMQFIQDIWS